MTNMEDMTPEEFDARLEQTEPVQVRVNLSRPAELFHVKVDNGVGFAAPRRYTEIVPANVGQPAAV